MTNRPTKSKRIGPMIVVSEVIAEIAIDDAGTRGPMESVGAALDPIIGGLNDAESRKFSADVLGVVVEITATAPPL